MSARDAARDDGEGERVRPGLAGEDDGARRRRREAGVRRASGCGRPRRAVVAAAGAVAGGAEPTGPGWERSS